MSAAADLLCAALAQEIAESGIRVYAVTSPATAAAGLAARELGAPGLALASGFTALDGSPVPQLTLGERGLFTAGPALRDDPFDTFALLARGRVGVAVGAGAARRPRSDEPVRDRRRARPAEGRAAGSARAARQQRRAVPRLVPAARARAASAGRVRRCRLRCGAAADVGPPAADPGRVLCARARRLGGEVADPGGRRARLGGRGVPDHDRWRPGRGRARRGCAGRPPACRSARARAVEFAGGREAAELFARIGALERGAVG